MSRVMVNKCTEPKEILESIVEEVDEAICLTKRKNSEMLVTNEIELSLKGVSNNMKITRDQDKRINSISSQEQDVHLQFKIFLNQDLEAY